MAVKRIFNPPPVAVCRLIEVVAPIVPFNACIRFPAPPKVVLFLVG